MTVADTPDTVLAALEAWVKRPPDEQSEWLFAATDDKGSRALNDIFGAVLLLGLDAGLTAASMIAADATVPDRFVPVKMLFVPKAVLTEAAVMAFVRKTAGPRCPDPLTVGSCVVFAPGDEGEIFETVLHSIAGGDFRIVGVRRDKTGGPHIDRDIEPPTRNWAG